MVKYSVEFKPKLVNDYSVNPFGYPRLAKKTGCLAMVNLPAEYGFFSHSKKKTRGTGRRTGCILFNSRWGYVAQTGAACQNTEIESKRLNPTIACEGLSESALKSDMNSTIFLIHRLLLNVILSVQLNRL